MNAPETFEFIKFKILVLNFTSFLQNEDDFNIFCCPDLRVSLELAVCPE